MGLALGESAGASGGDAVGTAMARSLVRSLVERDGLDPGDVLERHVAWAATRPLGLGAVTAGILARVAELPGAPESESARLDWEARGPEVSAGNGSVRYCAPLGAAYARTPERLVELAPALCALTHWDFRCRAACLAVTLTAAALVRGEDPRRSVEAAVGAVLELEGGEELEHLVDAAGTSRPVGGPDRSFVFFATGLGLRIAASGASFDEGIDEVTGFGGDTAANAALVGALLGAAHGLDALASSRHHLPDGLSDLRHEADALGDLAERGPSMA